MPAPRRLPSVSTLLKWRDEGLSHRQIADRIWHETGERVTRSAVSVALHRAGETEKVRYLEVVPWPAISSQHNGEYPLAMLRVMGRINRGLSVTDQQMKRLESWLDRLDDEQMVVAYDPTVGFTYVPRIPADGHAYVRQPSTVLDCTEDQGGSTIMNNPAATMSFWAAPAQARVTEKRGGFLCFYCPNEFDSARARNAHLSSHKQHAPAVPGTRGRKPKDPYAQGFRDGAMLANKEHREARRLKAEIKALRSEVKSLRKVRKILDGVR